MSGFISSPYALSTGVAAPHVAPTFVSAGTFAKQLVGVTPALPVGHTTNDLLIIVAEMDNTDGAMVVPTPAGWTEFTNSPQANGTAITLAAWWKRDNGAESVPTIQNNGVNSQSALILCFRGVVTAGNPIDAEAGGTGSGTSLTLPAVTATQDHDLIVNLVATGLDADSTTEFSGWTNANLLSITEASDNVTSLGAGHGSGTAYGVLAAAGSSGQTTVTTANSDSYAYLTIALSGI